jgi:hypothetical protein
MPEQQVTEKTGKTTFEKEYISNALYTGALTTDIVEKIKAAVKRNQNLIKVKITRPMALDILSLNTNNRPVLQRYVDQLSNFMVEGNWAYTPESIISISKKNTLLDSQHRLLAIVKSGKAQFFDINVGHDEESFKFLNKGRGRTPGDTLALEGFADPNRAAAAMTAILLHANHNKVGQGARSTLVTDIERVEFGRDEKNRARLLDCLKKSTEFFKTGKFLPLSVWAAMLFELGTARRQDADEFMSKLASGDSIGTKKDSAIYYCRRALEAFEPGNKGEGYARQLFLKVQWVITAWNLWIKTDADGHRIEITGMRIDKRAEELPKIERK